MKYDGYFFDFDYTLANSERGILICYRYVLQKYGYIGITDDEIKRTIGYSLPQSLKILTGCEDEAVLELYRQEYVKKADDEMARNTFMYPQAEPILRKIKEQGGKLGIISNKYRYRLMNTLEDNKIADLFDVVIGGEDVPEFKPNPCGLELAISRAGLEKSHTLYIGDSLVDAQTAQNAGVNFVGVTTGMTTDVDFQTYPYVLTCENLSGLEQLL